MEESFYHYEPRFELYTDLQSYEGKHRNMYCHRTLNQWDWYKTSKGKNLLRSVFKDIKETVNPCTEVFRKIKKFTKVYN